MTYENVKLWFAKNTDQDIITIDEINDDNRHDTYSCPVCGSTLKPKATKSKQVTSHFAHVDASKCNSETMVHWWFKHKFLEKGDIFTIVSDKERQYVCKDIIVEHPYEVGDKIYKPDVTILTECKNTIYFEMAFSNKKEIKDYLDIWLELKNIVVEIDIKKLMSKDTTHTFKVLFYDGKCFNTKRNDTYYNNIGKYKEKKLNGIVDHTLKERLQKLDWFWEDLIRYKKGYIDVSQLEKIIEYINVEEKFVVYDVLKKLKCIETEHILKKLKEELKKYNERFHTHSFQKPLPKESLIREAIKKLNRYFKNIDKGYKVILDRDSNKYKTHKWRYGRKIGIWVFDSYNYKIALQHEKKDLYINSVYINNLIVDMDNTDDIFNYLAGKLKEVFNDN